MNHLLKMVLCLRKDSRALFGLQLPCRFLEAAELDLPRLNLAIPPLVLKLL